MYFPRIGGIFRRGSGAAAVGGSSCTTVNLGASEIWVATEHGFPSDLTGYTFRQISGEADTLRLQRFQTGTWNDVGLLDSTLTTINTAQPLRVVNDADAASFEICPP